MARRRFLLTNLVAAAVLAGVLAGVLATDTATAAKRDPRCVRLEGRIADLRLKLRMGYSARQGRAYRQTLVALEAERREWCG